MQVREVMTSPVVTAEPDDAGRASIQAILDDPLNGPDRYDVSAQSCDRRWST